MSIKRNQSGFGHLALPLMALVVLVVGFSAYTVWHKQHQTPTANDTTSTTTAAVSIPAKIKTKADLHQASQALSNADRQMQSQLNSAALNSSINKML